MSKEEILEGNKLIAEFMDKPEWGNEFNVSHVKYHFSWDWLMPVYIKIAKEEKLWGDYEESIIIFNIMYDRLGDAEGIDKVYESVVEFIKWYNQNLTK
jgi:hypothetical protein